MHTLLRGGFGAGLIAVLFGANAYAGTVVVNNDEWTLSNGGFSNVPTDTARFVDNLAALFSTGPTGTFHAYSNNFGFTESSLSAALAGGGHTYTTGTGFAFTASNIAGFDGLFLGGHFLSSAELDTLADYVNSGGNVYLAGGTGVNQSAAEATAEAAAWAPFLDRFGLAFTSPYNDVFQNVDVSPSTHPLFDGVSMLYQARGSSITGPGIEVSLNGQGLYAVVTSTVVPLPAAGWLLMAGLIGVMGLAKR